MKVNNIAKVCMLILLFVVIISFVYGGIISKKDNELTAEFLKNELGLEVLSDGGCKGCSYMRNDDTFEEILTIPQGVKVKKCIEFCWLGELNLNGGTIVYDDGTELTAKASCVGVCAVEKGDIKMKSGDVLHVENIEMHVDEGAIKGGCKKTSCRFSTATLKQGSNFVYENGVLSIDKGDVYTTTGSLKIKLGDKNARIILPDGGKVKTDEIVEMVSNGYILPQESELTTKDNVRINVDDRTKVIPIGNDAKCKTGVNCIKFDDKSIDIYGEGVNTRLPKNFNKEIKTFPKLKGREITTIYSDGVKVIAKGEKGYPKIEPPGKKVKGYTMNGERLSYMINDDNIQVCSVEFNDITGGAVVDDRPKCKDGKVIEAGILKIGDDINIGMLINEDINCKVNYIEMPDKTKPVDINKDGRVDYIVDVGRDVCYKLDGYKKVEKECKKKGLTMQFCELPEGLIRGRGYKKDTLPEKIEVGKVQVPHKELSPVDKIIMGLGKIYDVSANEKSLNKLVCVAKLKTKKERESNQKITTGLSVERFCDTIWGKGSRISYIRGKSNLGCYNQFLKICTGYGHEDY